MRMLVAILLPFAMLPISTLHAEAALDAAIEAVEPKVVAWRRDIHQHPELGNREFRTAALVAAHLQQLGIQTQTNIAHTGVVGVLVGGRPGPVVALRAAMDALPVTERVDLPFALKVRTHGSTAGKLIPQQSDPATDQSQAARAAPRMECAARHDSSLKSVAYPVFIRRARTVMIQGVTPTPTGSTR